MESRRTPPLSIVLGYGAMLPLAACALAAWGLPSTRRTAFAFAVFWGSAILIFLGGVRRGLSFRTHGGPTKAQIATALSLFGLGFAALLSPSAPVALSLLLVGYVGTWILDPLAARRGEVPSFFSELRPRQMVIPVLSLLALLVLAVVRP